MQSLFALYNFGKPLQDTERKKHLQLKRYENRRRETRNECSLPCAEHPPLFDSRFDTFSSVDKDTQLPKHTKLLRHNNSKTNLHPIIEIDINQYEIAPERTRI
jgi:hypothetical protein